jgi:hypothetical protein
MVIESGHNIVLLTCRDTARGYENIATPRGLPKCFYKCRAAIEHNSKVNDFDPRILSHRKFGVEDPRRGQATLK